MTDFSFYGIILLAFLCGFLLGLMVGWWGALVITRQLKDY